MLVLNPSVQNRTKLIARIFALILPLLVLLPVLAQTASAKPITYVITDGDQTVVHTTTETDPHQILEEAGLELSADDLFTTAPGVDETEITVQRSQNITLTYCGEVMEVTSYGETLETMLDRLGLSAFGNHVASVSLDTMTYDGMTVTVNDVLQMEQTYTQEIPYQTSYCDDPSLPAGEEKVLVAGHPGQMQVTANVTYINSQEESRTVLNETVLTQPVDSVVLVGTGETVGTKSSAPLIGDGVIVTSDGEILTYTNSKQFITTAYTHTEPGCDMITSTGTTVRVGTIAVDPKVVSYGTRMFVVTNDGAYIYGLGTAEDCGGGVKGHHLDLYFPTLEECVQFGARIATVYFLD